jgi:hypothetical protein
MLGEFWLNLKFSFRTRYCAKGKNKKTAPHLETAFNHTLRLPSPYQVIHLDPLGLHGDGGILVHRLRTRLQG